MKNLLEKPYSKFPIIVFMFVMFVTVFEMNIVMVIAPTIAAMYNVDVQYVTLLNLGYAVAGCLSPYFGYISDKYSTKKVIVSAATLFMFGALLLVLKNTVVTYVISRTMLGLGFYVLTSLMSSYTSLYVPNNMIAHIGGYYKIAFGIGLVCPSLFGTRIVNAAGISGVYAFLAVLSFIAIILLLFIPDIKYNGENDNKVTFTDVKELMKDKVVIIFVIITLLVSVPSITFYNYYSIYLQTLGYDIIQTGNMYLFITFGSLISGILIVLFSKKVGPLRFLLIALTLSVIGILPLALPYKTVLMVMSFLFGLGYDGFWGLHFPLCSLLYLKTGGTFLSVLGFCMAFTNVITNMVAPLIYNFGGFLACIVVCFISLLLTLILYIYVSKNPNVHAKLVDRIK